jgi:hypothetical protein
LAYSADPVELQATISLLDSKLVVGIESWLMVKITNSTKERIYLDESYLQINTAVEYSDRSGILGPYTFRGTGSTSHGGPLPVVHLHEHTLAFEPGESLIKFVRLNSSMLAKPDKVTIFAHITFPGTTNPFLKGEEWDEFKAKAELPAKIKAANVKQAR